MENVASLTPCLRPTSAVFAPASCSPGIAMILSSLNLDRFIVLALPAVGLYPNVAEFQGLSSAGTTGTTNAVRRLLAREADQGAAGPCRSAN